MNNNDAVFEHIINQLRAHVSPRNAAIERNYGDALKAIDGRNAEIKSLENQLRDSSALIAELHQTIAELNETIEGYERVEAFRKIVYASEPEQSGCRKDDTQVEDTWINWEGGKCPVSGDTIVDVKFRNGSEEGGRTAASYAWDVHHGDYPIIAYRVTKAACKHPASQVCEDTGRCTYCGAVVIE